jgi:2-oxo-hept-3-ene-1,7-dioate hydratase
VATLTAGQIAAAVEALDTAERERRQIRALTLDWPAMDLDDAYAIQEAWVGRKVAAGRRIIGYKIGLTSRAMQQAMHIDTPDYGVLLDDMAFADGAVLRAADFTDPRLEAEFAFVLARPLAGEHVTVDEVLDATEHVVPALELIAARSFRSDPETGYTRTVVDTIADNAANAGVILGTRRLQPREVDLRWSGALLYRNGDIEETGLGAGVMDHPAHGIRWVCRRFARHGIGLQPGQVILSGSFTRPLRVTAGDRIRADYGPLGEINLAFT